MRGPSRKEAAEELKNIVLWSAQNAWAIALEKGLSVSERIGQFKTNIHRLKPLIPIDSYDNILRHEYWIDIAQPDLTGWNKLTPQEVDLLKRTYEYVTPSNREAKIFTLLQQAGIGVTRVVQITNQIQELKEKKNESVSR